MLKYISLGNMILHVCLSRLPQPQYGQFLAPFSEHLNVFYHRLQLTQILSAMPTCILVIKGSVCYMNSTIISKPFQIICPFLLPHQPVLYRYMLLGYVLFAGFIYTSMPSLSFHINYWLVVKVLSWHNPVC